MALFRRTIYLVTCAIVCGACGIDLGTEPNPTPVSPPEREILTTFMLLPDSVAMEEEGVFQLAIHVRNQRGWPAVFPLISYSTSAPLVARVGGSGRVTGIAPGTAVISAKTTVGDSTYRDSTIITVRQLTISDSLVLEATSRGWEPSSAHVKAGGKVEWRGGLIATAGVPVTEVYLMTSDSTAETIDLTRGPATRILSIPGVFQYCSNACWDPPEWGIIHVH